MSFVCIGFTTVTISGYSVFWRSADQEKTRVFGLYTGEFNTTDEISSSQSSIDDSVAKR